MSGAALEMKTELLADPALTRAQAALLNIAGTSFVEAVFNDIGEYLLISHRDRWGQGASPDGEPWEPLSARYRVRKRKNKDRILVLEGDLRDTLRYQADAARLAFGTDRIQGATHQFGDPDRNIPARPFLGLSEADGAEVRAIVQDHINRALKG